VQIMRGVLEILPGKGDIDGQEENTL